MQENNNEKRDKNYKNIIKEFFIQVIKKDIETIMSTYNHFFKYINFEKIKLNENSYTITSLVIDFENLKKATKEIEYLTTLLEKNKEMFKKATNDKEFFELFINFFEDKLNEDYLLTSWLKKRKELFINSFDDKLNEDYLLTSWLKKRKEEQKNGK